MRIVVLLAVCTPLLLTAAQAFELVVNGAFEEPPSTGWDLVFADSAYAITRATTYDPDPDYEIRLTKLDGTGRVRLDQVIPLPSLDVGFSASGRMLAEGGTASWAVAGLRVEYLDDGGGALGETAICAMSRACPWESSPDFHLIEAINDAWHSYSFPLADEIAAHLPAVDPTQVHAVRISLYAFVDDC